MILLETNHLKKMLGDRLLFSVDQLRVLKQDRIGIVGRNGAGKTTLIKVLAQITEADQGEVLTSSSIRVISQHKEPQGYQSGGELTRVYIQQAFAGTPDILFADEPTTHLDMESKKRLERKFNYFSGAIVFVSHDREFLDKVCTKIWEVADKTVTEYKGNFSDYIAQKQLEQRKQLERYEQYHEKKKQLMRAIQLKEQKAQQMIKPPTKRMGYSESKLWKMQKGTKQKNMHQAIKALETRIDKLEKVEKPKELPRVKMDLPTVSLMHNKVLIDVHQLVAQHHQRLLWKDVTFHIRGGQKVALIGPNGSGKTTLIKKIQQAHSGVSFHSKVKLGYFSQNVDILTDHQTILENVKETAIYPEEFIRTVLARLLFIGDDVFKHVRHLSGGERVKVAFAKIFLSDINLLLMDEPTNSLDIAGIEALEYLLANYQGTVLFISHDRQFIQKIATKILEIKDHTVISFDGTYQAYLENQKSPPKQQPEKMELLTVENRLSEILSKLSLNPDEKLEAEFQQLVKQRNKLRKKLK